ncbi:SRPBCC domain-containing protein [Dryocola sp. BD626]|uniref:SRPBCC domain-containing protein n=1 Tax=Dryocola sp. BD626 TaxID=3133273 RepID=UPI003F4FF546
MHAIHWPEGFIPGFSDNFASNEVIIAGLSAADVWGWLTDTHAWPDYYSNVSEVRFYDGTGPVLSAGARFRFTTFSFPIEAEVVEFVAPAEGLPGRLAWHGWAEGDAQTALDVHHAWLIEDLPQGRVRILTQETQNGKPARDLASALPNPMINAHQEWISGLANKALAHKQVGQA